MILHRHGARSDLLDYLERYRSTPRRRMWRVERWRRRGWSRGRIAATADALAASLHAAGIGDGDRVGLYLKDGPVWATALFGTLRAGAIAVPIDVSHPPDLVARLAKQLDLAGWVHDAELPELDLGIATFELGWDAPAPTLEPPRPPPDDPQRVAQLVLTSGTTHMPKSVGVRHENFRAVLDALESEVDGYRRLIRVAPRLRLAVALPMSHLYGQFMGLFLPTALDADVAIIDTMPATELAAAIRRERARVLATVPHTLGSLLGHLLDEGRGIWGAAELDRRLDVAASLSWSRRWLLFDRLRRRLGRGMVAVVSGGAALDPDVESLWKLLGYVVIQGYGLTEAAPLVTLNHPFHPRRGSVGKPLPGVEVRLAGDGEILVRGRNVAEPGGSGPQVDAEGWLHTGDLGERLEDGSIGFRGRRSDRIVTPAGVNVDPADVAVALRALPEIIDAIVVERPWGEAGTLCAVLVAHPGADVAASVRRANERFPAASQVRAWFRWPRGDLPRTPTGKVRRGEVLRWLEDRDPGRERGREATTDGAASTGLEQVLGAIVHPGAVPEDTRIGDLLSSLERVELAARLEDLYDVGFGDELFAGEQTIGNVAAALRDGNREERPPDRLARARQAEPGRRRRPDPAHWRYSFATRSVRFVLREFVMHPLTRLFLRIDVRAAPGFSELHGPFLLAVNHTSVMDPAILFTLPRRLRGRLAPAVRWNYFTEREDGKRRYFWGVLGFNLFPLVQAGDWRPTLRIAGGLAERGYSIVIYPEGSIFSDAEIHPFQQGVAVMSRELHLPIVPCATAGLERVLPRGSRWPRRDGARRPVMAVRIGDPLPAVRPGDDLDELIKKLEQRVRDLHGQARVAAAELERASSGAPPLE